MLPAKMTIMIEALLVLKTATETQQQLMILQYSLTTVHFEHYASTFKPEYIHKT